MKINVGKLDRVLRVIVGVILITLAATGIFTPWGWIGVVPLVTGLIKSCPLYSILGMNTCSIEKK